MSRREELLADHVYLVGGKVEENIDAPNGIVFPDDVEGVQRELFGFATEHLVSTLVDVKQAYPKKDTVDLTVSTDFVVMRREEFDELFRETFYSKGIDPIDDVRG